MQHIRIKESCKLVLWQ